MANFFKNLNFNFQHLLALIIVVSCFVYFFYISGPHYATVQNNHVVDVKTILGNVLVMVIMHYYRQPEKKKEDEQKPQ